MRYRLEWPSSPGLLAADAWSLHTDGDAARRAATRMLMRCRRRIAWVRVVLLDAGADAGDGFVTAADVDGWTTDLPLPPATAAAPVAPPEIDRLRGRALSAMDVVLGWSRRRGLLTQTAAEEVRLVFDAAMLGVVSHREP
jgi:hypothetical protein